MPPQNQDDQFDVVQHPILGPLKFPKDMNPDDRNQAIQYALSQRKTQGPISGSQPTSAMGPPPAPQSEPFGMDKIMGTYLPEALAAGNRVLNQPIQKTLLGMPSLTDQAAATKAGSAPAAQGGMGGVVADAKRFGITIPAGLGDYLTSPAGIAAIGLTALTGGAAAPWIAGAYTADTGNQAVQKYQAYKQNPNPDTLQDFLSTAAMTSAMGAGGKAEELPKLIAPDPRMVGATLDRSKAAAADMSQQVVTPKVVPPDTRMDQTAVQQKAEVAPPAVEPDAAAKGLTPQDVIAPTPPILSDVRRAEISRLAQAVAPRKMAETTDGLQPVPNTIIPPEIAPEPKLDSQLDSVSPLQQQIAQAAVESHPSVEPTTPQDEPLRRMVEDAGGKFRATDSMGYAHYDAPADAVGGRNGVTISSLISKMTPEFVQSEFARKATEFRGPITDQESAQAIQQGNVIPALHGSIQRLVDMKQDLDNTSDPARISQIQAAREAENRHATQLLQQHMATASPEELANLRDAVNEHATSHEAMADMITEAIAQHNRTAQFRQEAVDARAVDYTRESSAIDPETGTKIQAVREAETAPLSRSIFDQLQGRKPRVTIDDMVINKPKANLSEEQWNAFTGKMVNHLKAQIASVKRDAEIELSKLQPGDDQGQMLRDSGLLDRMKEIDRDARAIGTFPRAEQRPPKSGSESANWGGPGRRPNLLVTNPDGSIRPLAPGEGITLERAKQFMGRYVRQIPEQNELAQRAANLKETSRLYKVLGNTLDKVAKPELPVRDSQRGSVGEAALQGGHAGGGVASVEELNRPGRFVKISRGGMPTDQGKVPDFTLKPGEAGYQVKPDGSYELKAGQETPTTKVGVQSYAKQVYGRQAGWISGESMAGMAAGGLLGATHGPASAAIGAFIGGVAPAILRSKVIFDAFDTMRPIIKSLDITQKDWLNGPKQEPTVVPGMDKILEAQRKDIRGNPIQYKQRLAQLPQDFVRKFVDKTVMLTGPQSALGAYMARLDGRNVYMASDTPEAKTATMAFANAAREIQGNQAWNAFRFNDDTRTALKAGIYDNLQTYKNLQVYQRVNDSLIEKAKDEQLMQQNLQTKLQSPSLTDRQRIALQDDLSDSKARQKELTDRVANGEANPFGYTPDNVRNALQHMEQTIPPDKLALIKQLTQNVQDSNRQALDFLHSKGRISDEAYQKYTANGNTYIPASRIMSDMANDAMQFEKPGSSMYVKYENIIKALEGSERVNRDPDVASLAFQNHAISDAIKNDRINKYIMAAGADPKGLGSYIHPVDQGYQPVAGEGVIGHFIDGKPQLYAVPDWFKSTLDAPDVIHEFVGGAAAKFARGLFRTGATTLNFAFSTMRLPVDLARAATISKMGVDVNPEAPMQVAKMSYAWSKNFKSSLLKDKTWAEALRAGALQSGLEYVINPERFVKLTALDPKFKQVALRILHAPADFNAAVSDATKMVSYQRGLTQGMSPTEVSYETARYGGAPDYSRTGELGPVGNVITTFFNAHIQHITQDLGRVIQEPKLVVPRLAAITVMTMLAAQLNWSQKDDKGEPLMRRVPYTDRENNIVILTGGLDKNGIPNMVRIRKNSFQQILINPIENAIAKVAWGEDRTGQQLALDELSHLLPASGVRMEQGRVPETLARGAAASINPALRVPVEEYANQQFATGAPIVSNTKLKGKDTQYQIGPNTSPAAIEIGKLTGWSPQRLDYAARQATGGLTNEVQQPSNLLGRFGNAKMNQEDKNATDQFYANVNRVQSHAAALHQLMQVDQPRAVQYIKDNINDLRWNKTITKMEDKLGKLNSTQKEIAADKTMTDDQKQKAIQSLHEVKMQMLQAFNGAMSK